MKRLNYLIFCAILCMATIANAGVHKIPYTDTEIVNAIYTIEGGNLTNYPYGITPPCPYTKKQKFSRQLWAREMCFTTVRNHRIRHAEHNCGKDFLECLRDRYCPLNDKSDIRGLNENWLPNLMYMLERGRK